MAAELIFITVSLLLAWTFLIYPAGVTMAAHLMRKRGVIRRKTHDTQALPTVTVVMSVHNEDKVIRSKISSMLGSDYPDGQIDFIVGSDGSTDGTDLLVAGIAATDSRIRFIRNEERRGKAAMINDLVSMARGEILIVTDANVIFTSGTVRKLAEPFADQAAGLCDASPRPSVSVNGGITRQENLYSRFETALKRAEGDLWGAMPGPYGGCYAVRRSLFPRLPENILVDDLFAGLSVLKQNYRVINIHDAIVYEDTQPGISEQFRRRTRIAAGSFQNLFRFGLFFSHRAVVVIAFLSHKILRWLTPLLLSLFFMTSVILSGHSDFYFYITAVQLIFIILTALDLALDRKGKMIPFQRYVTQFLLMNAALAAGFVKALRGTETGIWEPTKRV